MNIPKITKLLRYRRPAWSVTEDQFIREYIDTIPGVYPDGYGNRLKVCEGSRTMISVHTDTVHWTSGMQKVQMERDIVSLCPSETEPIKGNTSKARPRDLFSGTKHTHKDKHGHKQVRLIDDWDRKLRGGKSKPYGSNCLGADDTAGIYAAMRMIDAGVKATFVFHRAEEIGGVGSQWLAEKYPKWIGSFDRCVALDRRGTTDIIMSQWGGRCCSDTFGLALSEQLGMGHKLAAGVFTDSANYAHLIPECTNVSVGYEREHTSKETLDVMYLERLIDRLVKVDWEGLPVVGNWVRGEVEEREDRERELSRTAKDQELEELAKLWALDMQQEKLSLAQLRKDIRFDEVEGTEEDSISFDIDEGAWEDQ